MTQLLFIPDSAIQNSNLGNNIQDQKSSKIDSSKNEFWQVFEKLIGKSHVSSSFAGQIDSDNFNFVGKNSLSVIKFSSGRAPLTGLQSVEALDLPLESSNSAVKNNSWSSIIDQLKSEIQITISINDNKSTEFNTNSNEIETEPKKQSGKLESKNWLGVSLSKGLAEKLEEILKQHSDQPQVQFYSSVNETKSSSLVNENPSEEKKPIVQSFVLRHNNQPITNSQNTQLNIDEVPYGNELLSLLDGEFESTPILNKTSTESSQVIALIRVSKEKLNQLQKINVESQPSTNNELILPINESLLKTQLTTNASDSPNESQVNFHPSKLNEGIWLLFTDKSNSPDISGKSNAQTVNESIGYGKILLDLDSTTLPKIDEQYLAELPKQVLENLSETLLHNSDVKVNEEDGIQEIIRVLNSAGSGDDKAQNIEESLKPKSTNQQTTAPIPNTDKVSELRNSAGSDDDKAQNLEESLKPKSTNQQTTAPNPNTEKVSELRNSEENEVTLEKINFPEKVKTTGSEVQNSEDIESKDKIKGPNKFVFISNETMKSLSNLARSEKKSMNFTTTEEVNYKLSTVKLDLMSDVNMPKVSLAQAQNTSQPTSRTLENKPIPSKEGLTPVAELILNSDETSIVNNEIGPREKKLNLKVYSEPFNQVSNPQKNAGNLEKVTQTREFTSEEIQETLKKPFTLLNSEDAKIDTNNKEKNKLSRNTNINRISIAQPTHSNQAKETPTQMNSFQGISSEKIEITFQENLPKNIKEFENAINSGKDDQKTDSIGIKSETVINALTKAQQDKTIGSENRPTQPTLKNDVIQMSFQKIDQPDNILKIQNNFNKPAIPLSSENIRDAIEQIVQSTKLYLTKDAQKISVLLKPEFLGMAKIVVESSEKEVKAILYIERPEVRNVLERQIIQIHKSLQDQNIRVDKIEVMDFSSQFSKNGTNTTGQDGRQMLEADRHLHELGSKNAMVNPGMGDDFNKRDFGYNTIELTA